MFPYQKNKKVKKYLAECVEKLAATVDEQSSLIKTLSLQGSSQIETVKEAQEKLRDLTIEYQVLKEQNRHLHAHIDSVKDDLAESEKAALLLNDKVSDLEKINLETSNQLKEAEQESIVRHKHTAALDEKVKSLLTQKDYLTNFVEELKEDIRRAQDECKAEQLSAKLLEKDKSTLEDALAKERKEYAYLKEKFATYKQNMERQRIESQRGRTELEAQNECLRYDLNTLNKKLQTTSDELNSAKHDKLLIMAYYNRQLQASRENRVKMWEVTTRQTEILADNLDAVECFSTDTEEKQVLQNKLCRLENQLFRQDQLLEELVNRLLEYDPQFSPAEIPNLKIYMEEKNIYHMYQGLSSESEHTLCSDTPESETEYSTSQTSLPVSTASQSEASSVL